MNKLLKFILPGNNYQKLRELLTKKTPPYVRNVYGFDLYQNTNDLDYSKHIGVDLGNINTSKDSDVLIMAKFFLKKGETAVDIGANIGLMSLAMSKFVGDEGRVVSIEPGPVSYGLLRANKFINQCSNIALIDAAVTDVDADVALFINPNGESDNQVHKGVNSYDFKNEKKREMHLVAGITLDKKLGDYCDISTIKFVKIDTQGHEWYVLNGAKKLFESLESVAVLCEFAPYLKAWEIVDVSKFFGLILDMKFTVYDISNLKYGVVDLSYLEKNYGFDKVGKYTDLLLLKGQSLMEFENAREHFL